MYTIGAAGPLRDHEANAAKATTAGPMRPDTAKGRGNGLGDIGTILMYAGLLHLGQSNIIKATKAMKQQNKIRPPNEKHERPTEMFRPELLMQRTKCA